MSFYSIYTLNKESAESLARSIKSKDKNKDFTFCDLIVIKHGFNWKYAFFYFNSLFALFHKRYSLAFLFLIISVLADVFSSSLIGLEINSSYSNLYVLIRFAIMFLVGVAGSSLTESYILSKGGEWIGSYNAKNEDEAVSKMYSTV